jgi:hypothetical protein
MSEEQRKEVAAAAAAATSGSLIDDLLSATNMRPGDDSYAVTRKGVQSFISSLLDPTRSTDRITASLARSASVTGSKAPPFDLSRAVSEDRKNGKMAAPERVASSSTKVSKSTADMALLRRLNGHA